jgi:translation initiation factor 1 (eIF-1/SUI1)
MEANPAQTICKRASPFAIKLLMFVSIFIIMAYSKVEAFAARSFTRRSICTLRLAREYVVIGGNLPGVDPDDENTYNLTKKERQQREREKGEIDFKNGTYKKKKKKFTINYDKLEEKVTRERSLMPREQREISNKLGVKSNLGVSEKPSKKNTGSVNKKMSMKAARIQRQRTAGGSIDSMGQSILPQSPEQQAVQIRVAKRGVKVVTMVQGKCMKLIQSILNTLTHNNIHILGMTLPMNDRKVMLKEMKAKFGGGGTLVDGVLEVQGSHADKVLDFLKAKGYCKAKVIKK